MTQDETIFFQLTSAGKFHDAAVWLTYIVRQEALAGFTPASDGQRPTLVGAVRSVEDLARKLREKLESVGRGEPGVPCESTVARQVEAVRKSAAARLAPPGSIIRRLLVWMLPREGTTIADIAAEFGWDNKHARTCCHNHGGRMTVDGDLVTLTEAGRAEAERLAEEEIR